MRRFLLLAPLLAAGPAAAHPHVFADARVEVSVAADRTVESLRIEWLFDEAYSLYARDGLGLDPDGDGLLTDEDRATLRDVHLEDMEQLSWFAFLRRAGELAPLAPPEAAEADMAGNRIVVRFTIRPKAATSFADATLRISDPTFFVALSLPKENVTYRGPADCRLAYEPPEDSLAFTSALGMNLGEGQAQAFGVTFASDITLSCD